MWKRSLILVIGISWLWICPLPAQERDGGIIFTKNRQFTIPFFPGKIDPQITYLQLFVSTDQGRTWQPAASVPRDKAGFQFITDRDGYYWFTVQAVYADGKKNPPSLEAAQPSLKVVIDTQPPRVVLHPLAPRTGEVGVGWDIKDDNPDLALGDAIRLEYRPAGTLSWVPLPFNPGATQLYWNPNNNGLVEVRLRARDRAGNWGEALASVSLTGQGFAGNNFGTHLPAPTDILKGHLQGERKLVNHRRINLNFELKDVGPSGISAVELWFTQDGRSWNKYPPRTGEEVNHKSLAFEVSGEGVYGITLVAKSGVGLGDRPPQLGDNPQLVIEVDLTKPVVQLHNVVVGQGMEKGKLTLTWSANDRNLHREPITLSYAEQAGGPWTPIAQNLANTGRYVWTMPEGVPYQFYVKVEAADQAGNIGETISNYQVKVDLSQPKVRILNIEPGGSP